ncbi:unnamed protein product [Protopolystoma xenopodis]|uniref:Uncharacterized protein n=1 Tax=Protopolystoma xenopodis TaxID=117903 RepID=A0A448XA62_9PLAT|nr:unnamed protein product [Protopolystoma xenopodis]
MIRVLLSLRCIRRNHWSEHDGWPFSVEQEPLKSSPMERSLRVLPDCPDTSIPTPTVESTSSTSVPFPENEVASDCGLDEENGFVEIGTFSPLRNHRTRGVGSVRM